MNGLFVQCITTHKRGWSNRDVYMFGRNLKHESVCVRVKDFRPSLLLGSVSIEESEESDVLLCLTEEYHKWNPNKNSHRVNPFYSIQQEELVNLIGFTNNTPSTYWRVYLQNPHFIWTVCEFFRNTQLLTLCGKEFDDFKVYHEDWSVEQQFMHCNQLQYGDFVRLQEPVVTAERLSCATREYEVTRFHVVHPTPSPATKHLCVALAGDFDHHGQLVGASAVRWWDQDAGQRTVEHFEANSERQVLQKLFKFTRDADYLVYDRDLLKLLVQRCKATKVDPLLSRFTRTSWLKTFRDKPHVQMLMSVGRGRLCMEAALGSMNASPPLDTFTTEAAVCHPGICRNPRVAKTSELAKTPASGRVMWLFELTVDNNFIISSQTISRASNTAFTKVVEGGQQRKVWNTLLAYFYQAKLVVNKSNDCDAVIVTRSNTNSSFPDPNLPPNVPLRARRAHKTQATQKKRSLDLLGNPVPTQAEVKKRKTDQKRRKGSKQFKGGYVTEPQSGYYDQPWEGTVTVDFKSMYPSIIRGYRLCYMSVVTDDRWLKDPKARCLYLSHDTDKNQAFVIITHYDGQPVRTIVPEIVEEVMKLRKKAKQEMKLAKKTGKEFEAVCLNFRQLSYKVFQNSVYGFFGARKNALLGYKLLMAGICVIGQFMIKLVTAEALKMRAFVVYGDTDSIMVQFDNISSDPTTAKLEIFNKASTLTNRCNQLFPAPNELEVETLKLPFACLKRKMYFAYELEATDTGWIPKGKITTKGMGYKKRDRCKWVREIGHDVVRLMLSGYPEQVVPHIREAVVKLRTQSLDYEKLTITCLMQSEDKYYKSGNLIQVETARKVVARGGQFPSGDRLEYVVLLAPGQPLYKRGETTAYARDNNLKLDLKYYLTSQLLKSLTGLLEHHPKINESIRRIIVNEGERAEQAGQGCRSLLEFFNPKGS